MKYCKASLAFIFTTVAVDVIGVGIMISAIPELIVNVAEVSFILIGCVTA
jgi:hypothetical protein